jgi:hypothetical protein
MIDFTEIGEYGEQWELFARDFLQEIGFHIESHPDRGADGGKDILVTEDVTGTLYKGRFRWLVSCKNFAKSGKSVSEARDELNIIERLGSFRAKGFIGFYSTLASAGLNTRLRQLLDEEKISAFRIFDHKIIENYLITAGYSKLMIRYFPSSYKKIKPIHSILDEYVPLKCNLCKKDLLIDLFSKEYSANLVHIERYDEESSKTLIQEVYVACKENCDRNLSTSAETRGMTTGWTDISDLTIPIEFLRYVFAIMNNIRQGTINFTDEAFDKEKEILISIAQKVLRFTTEDERKRFNVLSSIRF